MIAKTFALVIAMSVSLTSTMVKTPNFIPVEINFCEFTSGNGESICNIKEAENLSRNKIFFDIEGNNPKLLIDKRNVTSDKTKYIFGNDVITINKQNKINMPYIRKSLLIEPGVYKIEHSNQGYIISLSNSE